MRMLWGASVAHARVAGLPNHDDVMLLMPLLPILLIVAIVGVTVAAQRGLLGDPHRQVDIAAPLAVVAAGMSLGAAGIHFAVIPEHLAEDVATGMFFLALAWFQVIWAMAFVVRRNDTLRAIGALVNIGVVMLWLVSRTTGLPVGATPWVPEAIGLRDLFATSFEVILATMLSFSLATRSAHRLSGSPVPIEKAYVLSSFCIATVVVLTGFALLGAAWA